MHEEAPVKTQVVDEDIENQEKHKSVQIRIASNGESQEVVMIPYTTQSGQTEDGAEQGKFVVLEKGEENSPNSDDEAKDQEVDHEEIAPETEIIEDEDTVELTPYKENSNNGKTTGNKLFSYFLKEANRATSSPRYLPVHMSRAMKWSTGTTLNRVIWSWSCSSS